VRRALSIGVVAPLVAPLSDSHPYGNQIFLADLAKGLAARGHSVTVYAAEGSRVDGVAVEPIAADACIRRRFVLLRENAPAEADAMQRAFEKLFQRMRLRRHDVLSQHAFDREAIEGCVEAPALHTLHLPPMREEVIDAARKCGMPLATVSRRCAGLWREATGREVLTIPNGIPALDAPRAPVRPVALAAGRISPEKGIAAAIDTARQAGLEPLLVGEIYDEAYWRAEVRPRLNGTGYVPTVPRAKLRRMMAGAAVTLMPVEWEEPFGLVAAEAQLAGCPVAGYRRGALPEIVEDGVGGYLAEPGDRTALLAAVRLSLRLDREGIRRRAAGRFGLEACIDRYERELAQIA
jgi:UDP-glucose:tetrahydrobiopterin glucosyltransferase